MAKSKFFEEIKKCIIEREVEDVYNKGINMYFPNVNIEHPFGCDGFIKTKTENGKLLHLIIEYKLNEAFSLPVVRAKILVQVLYYLKRFEQNGVILPNVIMVGDNDECFVFHTNTIIKYLDENVNWSISPSTAHNYNADLILKIVNDNDFNPFIFNINENFSFKEVADKIIDLADNIQRYVHVTEHNICTIFDHFSKKVLKNSEKIGANDLVSIFMGVITDKDNYYQHPTKQNLLVTPYTQMSIDGGAFKSFFEHFNRTYTPQEKNKFAEISDRLIEDTNRRRKGEFYTPTPFVDYAHKLMSEQFGENWKNDYVVFDCCCGTKNLTRDYHFKELYCSTLENAELEISKRYNQNAISFQFDFLNDDLSKLPQGLLNAFEQNKPIIFFINPPYGTGCNFGETSKKETNKTKTREKMHNDNLGAGSENLQHQFMYNICKLKEKYNLTNIHIGLFSKPIYLSGAKQKEFLQYFCNNFEYKNGILFQASHFSDVSDAWGITFNIWSNGKTKDIHNFEHNLIDFNNDNEIYIFDKKNIYNVWGGKLDSDRVKEKVKHLKTFDYPNLTSGVKVKEAGNGCVGRLVENAFGYYVNGGNNVGKSLREVSLFSSAYSNGHGSSIIRENFKEVVTNFSARKLITGNWINDKDEYLVPNMEHSKYKEFENDSVVYSLFNTSSNQSSLRNIEYSGKKWDIKNNFFWMSNKEIKDLANENYNDSVWDDCQNFGGERYVYQLLQNIELSKEAKAVLEKATELVKLSFKYRKLMDDKYHINTWDAGWYQIKAICNAYLKKELKEFEALYKKLSDKMKPMVYELGFLK